MKRENMFRISIGVLFLVLVVFVCYRGSQSNAVIFYCHRLFKPADLYEPISCEKMEFDVGAKVKLHPEFRYRDAYEILIWDKAEAIPSEYRFSGKIQIDLIRNGQILKTTIVEKDIATEFSGNNYEFVKHVSLYSFDMYSLDDMKGFEILITVLRRDRQLEKYKKNIYVIVRVTAED